MSYTFIYKQADFDSAQATFITSRKAMNDALATMAGYASEMGVIRKDSTYLRKIVELVENKFRSSVEAWLTQEQLPFVKPVGKAEDAGKIKFSEAKARRILGLDAKAPLTDADLAKLASQAVGVVKATAWDSSFKKEQAEKRAAKKAEKAEQEARNNTQSAEGVTTGGVEIPAELGNIVALLRKVDTKHLPAIAVYIEAYLPKTAAA